MEIPLADGGFTLVLEIRFRAGLELIENFRLKDYCIFSDSFRRGLNIYIELVKMQMRHPEHQS